MTHPSTSIPGEVRDPVRGQTEASDEPPASDGLTWVSWLKVIAITGVVLIHTAGLTAVAPGARSTTQGQLAIALDFSSRWAVPVFIMVSGALLLDPSRFTTTRDFLRRRALRIVPAIVVWHLVYLAFRVVSLDTPISVATAIRLTLTGKLWTALYFFWIVLGLAIITPMLVPWIATVSRRTQLVAGIVAASIPALTLVTVPIRGADLVWVETPWTWWIPYVGYYLLGHALRDVVVTRWRLVLTSALVVAGSALLAWQWRRPEGLGRLIEHYLPAESYYSPVVVVTAVSVFLTVRALIRPDGLLRVLCRRSPSRLARHLADATLGVFGVHLLVLEGVLRIPKVGGPRAAGSVPELLVRCVLVLVIAYLVSLIARRIPLVRRAF